MLYFGSQQTAGSQQREVSCPSTILTARFYISGTLLCSVAQGWLSPPLGLSLGNNTYSSLYVKCPQQAVMDKKRDVVDYYSSVHIVMYRGMCICLFIFVYMCLFFAPPSFCLDSFFLHKGSLIQVPMSEKGKITRGRLGSLSLKKEGERQCFLFSKHLIICTRGSGGKLHLTKVGLSC